MMQRFDIQSSNRFDHRISDESVKGQYLLRFDICFEGSVVRSSNIWWVRKGSIFDEVRRFDGSTIEPFEPSNICGFGNPNPVYSLLITVVMSQICYIISAYYYSNVVVIVFRSNNFLRFI